MELRSSPPRWTAGFCPNPCEVGAELHRYPRAGTVVTLFENIVRENPDKVALIQGDIELTYGELNRRANRLAHRLGLAGVTLESLVPCCLQRSVEMIVAFLAVLKAGAAYVPIDPAYPEARRNLMLEDAGEGVLVTHSSLVPSFHQQNLLGLLLQRMDQRPLLEAKRTRS